MAELTLEQQVARLAAIEDIKQMKARYCHYADHGYDPDGLASLFVEDAHWDGGQFGVYEGREAIREFFTGIGDDIVFAIHPDEPDHHRRRRHGEREMVAHHVVHHDGRWPQGGALVRRRV